MSPSSGSSTTKPDANFTRIDRRLDTLTDDVAVIKGYNARAETVRQAWDIALDLGLEYVRTLPSAELGQMAQAAAGSIPTNELRSFRRADLVIEATDASSNTHYIAAEISFHRRPAGLDPGPAECRVADPVHRPIPPAPSSPASRTTRSWTR